ncbi:hypothetical protein BKI52_19740 [marine bacterium AO1-C]|nr:hypothetical protein BKI52_19740 [marine bacterium AO1-C]
MPRTAEQFANIRQERKEEILQVALRLFGEKGYEATSIDMIAKTANISKGLVYNYFENKQKLLETVLDMFFEKLGDTFKALYDSAEPAEVIIRQMLYTLRDSMKADIEFWQFYTRLSFQFTEYLKRQYGAEMGRWMHKVTAMMEELRFANPQIEAIKLGSIIDGICINYILAPKFYPIDEVIENVADGFETQRADPR